MNSNVLADLYDQLHPYERLPLIIAAGARGDATEQRRLSAAAPQISQNVPDYYPLAHALEEIVHFHLETLLNLATQFWLWHGWSVSLETRIALADATPRSNDTIDNVVARAWRAERVCRYYASRIVAGVEGWKQFCAELHIDPEVQLNFMVGWDTIVLTCQTAQKWVFTAEEAERFVRAETISVKGSETMACGPVGVESPADVAAGWQRILEKLVIQGSGTVRPSGANASFADVAIR